MRMSTKEEYVDSNYRAGGITGSKNHVDAN